MSVKNINYPRESIFLVPAIYYILHILEELPKFAEWSSRHYSEKSPLAFAIFEIASYSLVLLIVSKAITSSNPIWKVLAVAAQIQFGLNSIFHLYSAIHFSEYSPGMVTGGSIGLFSTYFVIRFVIKHRLLTRNQLIASILIGSVIAGLAIGALYL